MFDVDEIRAQFPILQKKDLVYLDTAASAQKPRKVINAISYFLENEYSNIHRGAHFLGDIATERFEEARKKIAKFLNVNSPREIIFGKNATEMINLVVNSLDADGFFQEGDTILLTRMEHHANLIPWIMLAKKQNLKISFLEMDENKELILDEEKFKGVKFVSVAHVSNVLGTRNPVEKICELAKKYGALSLIDGCQVVPHFPVDVQKIDCDFYAFSSHKIYGPSGVGVLYGKKDLLKKMSPFLGGGEMIRSVSFTDFTPNEIPHRFEAGTPPIESVVGCGAATDFLNEIGIGEIQKHDEEISKFAFQKLSEIPEIQIVSHKEANGLVTFFCKEKQNYDLSDFLSDRGICVRVGHHCAEPLHDLINAKTTIRASFGMYTTTEEIEILVKEMKNFFAEK